MQAPHISLLAVKFKNLDI